MKKAFLLLFCSLFVIFGLNAQTVVLSEDFSLVGADSNNSAYNHLDQYTHDPGWTCDRVYTSTEKLRVGTSTKAGFLMTPVVNVSGNNGNFTVSFDAKVWSTTSATDKTSMYVVVVNGTDSVVETVTGLSASQFQTFTLAFTNGTTGTKIKFKSYQDSKARFFIDNIVITSVASGPDTIGPHISSVNPSNNALTVNFNEVLDPTTAQNTSNYSLDNNISVTSATLNGSAVTLAVSPALVEGNTYTLIVSNVADVSGNLMPNPDTISFAYGVSPDFHVSSIAELRSKWTAALNYDSLHFGSDVYKLTGHVFVTAINESYRNQVFIQDATGAIVIDDPDDKIITALEIGDEITDLYGTLTDYYGQLQFAMAEPYDAISISLYNEVTPLTVTVAQMQDLDFMNSHQNELILINGVKINPVSSTTTFENNKKYNLTQNGETGTGLWTHIYNVTGIVNEPIPTTQVNLIGVNKISYSKYYLIPRASTDLITGISQYLTENDVVVYPNPVSDRLTVSLRTDAFQVTNMAVYDINGKFVKAQSVNDNQIVMDVQSLASGNYFLRLSDGKKSVTTKFVKK